MSPTNTDLNSTSPHDPQEQVTQSHVTARGSRSSSNLSKRNAKSSAAKRVAILILGMHRSGTSAVTRVINMLGADLPSHLMPAVEGNNETGFWESVDVFHLNDEILTSGGSSWDDWRRFNPDWFQSVATKEFKARAVAILERDFSNSSLFVLKDPRICRLLPFWLDVLREFEAAPKFLLPLRNPLEVAASLKRRDGFSPPKSNILWLRHVLDGEQRSRGLSRAFLSYEGLLDDWRSAVGGLSRALDIAWPRRSATAEVEIDRFLEHRHRHHALDNAQIYEHPDVATWVKKTYAALTELYENPESANALRRLDVVRSEFNRASDALGAVLRSEEIAREELAARSSAHIVDLQQAAEMRELRLNELEEASTSRDSRIVELEDTLANRSDRITELEDALDQSADRIVELEHVTARRAALIENQEETISRGAARINGLEGTVGEREIRITELKTEAARLEARIAELEHGATESEARITAFGIDVAEYESRIGQLKSELTSEQRSNVEHWRLRNHLLHRLNSIQTSATWQLASPFRAAESRWPKIVRGIGAPPKFAYWALTFRLRARLRLRRQARSLLVLRLFDLPWYVEHNPDVVLHGMNPVLHWLVTGWREGRDPHPLFDAKGYLSRNPDVAEAGFNPLLHYLASGGKEGRDPCLLFDTDWYLTENPDVLELGVNPLAHFLANGVLEGRDPNPLFDTDWYLRQNPGLAEAGKNPVIHYLERGAKEGRNPHPLFDTSWYLKQNQDIAIAGINPLVHYLACGAAEGRDPNPLFDSDWYLAQNPDIAEAGINPLSHYLAGGAAEGRDPNPLFDSSWYLAQNPDVADSGVNPLTHYLERGAVQGRDPNPLFASGWYLAKNPDIAEARMNPLAHYLTSGAAEGRNPNWLFDSHWYVEQNPDIAAAGINPLAHYLASGAAEGRDPSPQFDSARYLAQNPDVVEAIMNPLAHYLTSRAAESCDTGTSIHQESFLDKRQSISKPGLSKQTNFQTTREVGGGNFTSGHRDGFSYTQTTTKVLSKLHRLLTKGPREQMDLDREIREIRDSLMFDSQYYKDKYPDVAQNAIDPIDHYCRYGWKAGRNPNDEFDTNFYIQHYPDVSKSGQNPFHHYVAHGIKEGRVIRPRQGRDDGFEPECRFGSIDTDIKPIAFYLPQFHSIPENDAWWGEGFTEWTNVRAALPLLERHDQPRVPHPHIGYYDLNDWRVLDQQARLAKSHGIYGFCFYHYYFAGKRLLDTPLNELRKHPEIDLRYCLCWANENWTRTWDGGDDEILIAQEHSHDDDLRFIDDLRPYLEDPRYIRVDGKPMILLYRPHLLPDMKATAARWRARLRESGIGEIYLVCTYANLGKEITPEGFGCDAGVEFPPNIHIADQTYNNYWSKLGFPGKLHSYPRFFSGLREHRRKLPVDFDLYRSVMLRWDNTPRRKERGAVFWGFTASRYREWLDYTLTETRRAHPAKRRFMFINAWNEWAEGTYLEPDKHYGYRLLNETSRALAGIAPSRVLPKVSVIVPNYNHARFLQQRLDSIYGQTYQNIEVLLLDDASTDDSCAILREYAARYPDITRTYFNDNNSGSVFRQWRKGIELARGDLIWIAESDDYCDPNFIDTLVDTFEDEAVMLSYAHYVFVDEEGHPQEWGFEGYVGVIDEQKWTKSYVNTAHDEVRSALGIRNTIPNVSGILFRKPKNLVLLDDPVWLDMRIAGDWVFYLHLMRGGKVAYRVSTSSYFRFHSRNTSVATYSTDAYYREHGIVAYHTALLYDVPEKTLRNNFEITRNFYRDFVPNGSDHALESLFGYDRVLQAQSGRLPNIMISLLAFSTGGAEVTPVLLANELKKRGISVLVHSRDYTPENERIRRKLRADIPVVRLSHASDLKNTMEHFGIEVVNSHHHAIQRFVLEDPSVFSNVAHIGTLHGIYEIMDVESPATVDHELPIIDSAVSSWTYVAEKNLAPFRNRGIYTPERFCDIPNGIDPGNIDPVHRLDIGIPEDAFVLCIVSRAIEEKGWLDGIEIVSRARESTGRDIHLILVGDGPVYDRLRRDGTDPFVHAVGFHEHPIDYFAAADMGFLPSRYRGESMPNSLIECFFAGKPVIASDLGDIRRMLTIDGETAGAIIPVQNWILDIATATDEVAKFALDRDEYCFTLGLVPKLADRYRIDKIVDRYLDVFTNVNSNKVREIGV